MKALNLFNAVMLALAVTFALMLGVVFIIYSFYLDATPRMRGDWLQVGKITSLFVLLSAVAAAAFVGQRRVARWRWPAQGVLLLMLAAGGGWLAQLLQK